MNKPCKPSDFVVATKSQTRRKPQSGPANVIAKTTDHPPAAHQSRDEQSPRRRRAVDVSKPIRGEPVCTDHGDQASLETQANAVSGAQDHPAPAKSGRKVGKREAIMQPPPIAAAPSALPIDGDEPSRRRARKDAQSIDAAPGGTNSKPARKCGADQAIVVANTTLGSPDQHQYSSGHTLPANHSRDAAAVDRPGHANVGTHGESAGTIDTIRELWRRRQAWHRAEKSLTLQSSAICRRYVGDGDDRAKQLKLASAMLSRIESGEPLHGDQAAVEATLPLLAARPTLEQHRVAIERQLAKLAKTLPVAPWAVSVYGVSLNSLAAIVGEAGDVGSYKSVAALWKRFGLAVMQSPAGEMIRQQKKAGVEGIEHGYAPARRSVMWNVGGGLIGCMGKGPRPFVGEDIDANAEWSPYQKLFLHRLRYEAERDPTHAREPKADKKTGALKESYSAHAANRAKRYVEKRFLRDLYAAWRATGGGQPESANQKSCASAGTNHDA